MKKLTLQAEELKVESFATSAVDAQTGTVNGQEMVPTPPYICPVGTRPTNCPCTPVI